MTFTDLKESLIDEIPNTIANRKPCIIFDIDGTLANCEHRVHHVTNGNKNWPDFNLGMALDTPNFEIIFLLKLLSQYFTVFIVSGREELYRDITETWLKNIANIDHGKHYKTLYLRPTKDNRGDETIKKELLVQIRSNGYEPLIVFDDRNKVVDMWRANGIRCLQVQPGDF